MGLTRAWLSKDLKLFGPNKMADWIEAFQVTIPAGTTRPGQTYSLKFKRPGKIERIEIVIPDGPAGRVGFQLLFAGTVVLPFDDKKYIISNNEKISWEIFQKYDTGDWAIRAYNEGVYDHTIYIRFLVIDPTPTRTSPQLVGTTRSAVISSMSG